MNDLPSPYAANMPSVFPSGMTDLPQQKTVVPPVWRQVPIQFTGQGRLYFRIWYVNLLLTLVTVGFYYPWAKARRLRFFHGNTLLDGQPFEFHGDPFKMFKGYLIGLSLFGAYSVTAQFAPVYHWSLLLVFAVIYPLLVRSSRRFYMANTSWRGLRFHFSGSAKQAVMTYWPVIAVIAVVVLQLATDLLPEPTDDAASAEKTRYLIGVSVAGPVAVVVWFWVGYRMVAYLQEHLGWGRLHSRFVGSWQSVVGYQIKTGLVYVGCIALMVVPAMLLLIVTSKPSGKDGPSMPELALGLGFLLATVFALSVVALMSFVSAYYQSRKQNVIWNNTGHPHLRFVSDLRCTRLWLLRMKNWLLMILTLGLYSPYAAMAIAKLRLESVAIETTLDFDQMLALSDRLKANVVGDAVTDIFDIDVGF